MPALVPGDERIDHPGAERATVAGPIPARLGICDRPRSSLPPHTGLSQTEVSWNSTTPWQSGIGAGQQVDPDTLFERMVGPYALDDYDPPLQPIEGAGVNDNAAAAVADSHPVAIGDPEPGECRGMDQRGRP